LVQLPFTFSVAFPESSPYPIRAVVLNSPFGEGLMLVFNTAAEEHSYALALENLISYIGAEMTKPMQQLVLDLQMLGNQGGQPSAMLAAAKANELSEELTKLHDLATVLGHGAIQGDDRIEFRELVKQAQANVAVLATQRGVTFSLVGFESELPTVYGNQALLHRALCEYLEHSIRGAQRGGLIGLAVEAAGTQLILHARNQGSSHAAQSAFLASGMDDDQLSVARPGIGLAIAQRIVEQHGGAVRVEDDMDGIDFVMEIPAGAPIKHDAQMSVEQAQHYAFNVSELLARSLAKGQA
jgi:K+-sensing histidine kinase KdpD